MTDPAVEAARKALDNVGFGRSGHVQRVASAREALRPIREKCDAIRTAAGKRLHPTDPGYDIGNAFDDGVLSLIDELAPLIFTTEELER